MWPCLSQPTPQGATYPYPPGTYRLKFIGQGTVQLTGDGAVTLSNAAANTYVSTPVIISAPTSFLQLVISAVGSSTDYPRDISVVNTSWTSLYDAGEIFHPYYLNVLANISSLRFMQPSGVYTSYHGLSPASYPISAGVNSFTLGDGAGTASNWLFPTQTRKIYFIDGEIMDATFTLGSSTVALSSTLSNSITSNTWNGTDFYCAAVISWMDVFSERTPAGYVSWNTPTRQMPIEIQIALCNKLGTDYYANLHPTCTVADAGSFIDAVINGTGLAAGYSPLNSTAKCRVEYANETWSGTGFQDYWMRIFGANTWPTLASGNPYAWNRNWYGYHIIQMANQMQTTLGSTVFNARVNPVIAGQGQTGGTASVTAALWNSSSFWSGSSASNTIVKDIAIADYWPVSYTGWINTADAATLISNGLNDFFAIAKSNTATGASGYTYTSVNTGGYLGQMETLRSAWSSLASSYNIIAYEGNTSFVASDDHGVNGGTVTGWGNFIISALRDPRMQTLYTTYLNDWPFGNTKANMRHLFQDVQAQPNPVTGPNYQGAFYLVEGSMQLDGSVSVAAGGYYKWAAAQAYMT